MDYEKAYKEAIERAKVEQETFFNLGNISAKTAIERIFPELRESEDERIRKSIIDLVEKQMPKSENKKWMIAWLEKQKCNTTIKFSEEDEKTRLWIVHVLCECGYKFNDNGEREDAFELLEKIKQMIRGGSLEKQGEQKPVEQDTETRDLWEYIREYIDKFGRLPKDEDELADCIDYVMKRQKPIIIIPQFKVGDIIKPKPYNEEHLIKDINENGYVLDVDIIIPFKDEDVREIVEQKRTWSEEDEKMILDTIKAFQLAYPYATEEENPRKRNIDWLKSLKDRIQPKQEWSKEDNERLLRIHQFIWTNRKGDTDEIYQQEQDADWLMSIIPQQNKYDKGYNDGYSAAKYNHWKPSEEQMNCLETLIDCGFYIPSTMSRAPIESLYNDLKKL